MRAVMDDKQCIRNVSVIAHVDHGKSTLFEYLLYTVGFTLAEIDADKKSSVIVEEKKFNTAMKSNHVSLRFECSLEIDRVATMEENTLSNTVIYKKSYLINLMIAPGNLDFSCDVQLSSLLMADGALVVVDCIEGVAVQTSILLHQAMRKGVRPCLMINKMDRALLELQLTGEEIYQMVRRTIEDTNEIVASYKSQHRDWQVTPVRGNICFGSGLHQWGFTLKTFAKMYASKFNTTEEKMTEKLWGDWVFHTADGKSKWINSTSVNSNNSVDRETGAKRAFVAFIMDPILGMFQAAINSEVTKKGTPKAHHMAAAVGVNLSEEVKKTLTGKPLFKYILQQWLPLSAAVKEMMVVHLPCPAVAQEYRCAALYNGPLDDETATAIRTCDASTDAPMIMYVSKLNVGAKGRFSAFGRVLSGKLREGQKLRLFDPAGVSGTTEGNMDLSSATMAVQNVLVWTGRQSSTVADVPAGNLCGFVGRCNQSPGVAELTVTAKLLVEAKS